MLQPNSVFEIPYLFNITLTPNEEITTPIDNTATFDVLFKKESGLK